ncbi:MAG: hypothetical protein LJE89_07940 [Deltaproteobacteria bacterium]|nr:hypothetical protein [Deltaproteobacteria bacterium]
MRDFGLRIWHCRLRNRHLPFSAKDNFEIFDEFYDFYDFCDLNSFSNYNDLNNFDDQIINIYDRIPLLEGRSIGARADHLNKDNG